ncbi:MAG TPA: glycosyltransferase [Gemmatimonadaceae bacterium]|nr:glycosyltransferase [Gemmatimonadaceae bacterium]
MIRTVIHFSDSSVFGGTERAILHLIAGADRTRWRTVLMHDSTAPRELVAEAERAGAETVLTPSVRRKYDVGQFARLATTIRRQEPAVFHAHLHWPLAAKYGIMAAAAARTPVVVATAQLHVEIASGGFVDTQHRVMTSAVDRYIAVSAHVAGALEQRFRVPPAKIVVIPNAVDVGAFTARGSTPAGWPGVSGRSVVLVLARLEVEKAVGVAIDAIADVPDVDLVVAGTGSLRAALEEQARALGIGDRVHFLGQRSDVAALLEHAQALLLPSLREGLPLSLLEAMASGVPVVATDIGGTRDLVTHDETGLLVPVNDAAALATAIRRTLVEREATARRVTVAREVVRAEYSTDVVVRRVFALYDTLLGGRTS